MRISVVTPSFNMAPYLEDTIQSVIGNLRTGDEYFVVGDNRSMRMEDHDFGKATRNRIVGRMLF